MFLVDDVERADKTVGSTHSAVDRKYQSNRKGKPRDACVCGHDAYKLIFDDRGNFAGHHFDDRLHLGMHGIDIADQAVNHDGRSYQRSKRKEGEKCHTCPQKRQIVESPHRPHPPKNLFPSGFRHLQRAFSGCTGRVFGG